VNKQLPRLVQGGPKMDSFLRVDNFLTVSGRKAQDYQHFANFIRKRVKIARHAFI